MSFFGLFGYSAPVVRFPHRPALVTAMQSAHLAWEHDGPVVCSIAGLNSVEVALVRQYADPENAGYTMPVGDSVMLFNAQCVTDMIGVAEADRHWDDEAVIGFAREEDRVDFFPSETLEVAAEEAEESAEESAYESAEESAEDDTEESEE